MRDLMPMEGISGTDQQFLKAMIVFPARFFPAFYSVYRTRNITIERRDMRVQKPDRGAFHALHLIDVDMYI